MIHIYECNDYHTPGNTTRYWEVFQSVIGDPWGDEFLFDITTEKDYLKYLDELHHDGLDYVIHNNDEEYDEFHIALPSL